MKGILGLLRYLDLYILISAFFLLTIGSIAIYSLAVTRDQMGLFHQHMLMIVLGLIVMVLASTFDYRKLKGLSPLLYLIGVALLIVISVSGVTQFGATSWLNIGFFQFQPSEPIKIFLILLIARILSSNHQKMTLTKILFSLGLVAIPVILIIEQPDLGTGGVIIIMTIIMFACARLSKIYWLALGLIGIVLALIIWVNLEEYQISRLETFLNPSNDPFGSGYNVIQSMIAVGNGGIYGQGIGQGTQSQLDFLPVAHTDFIFAVIAEASGFLGSLFVILIFSILILRTLIIMNFVRDSFGTFLGVGIASFWSIQFIVNTAMVLGLAPVTGITLPFVSYGGTSMVTNLLALGIIESIHINNKQNLNFGVSAKINKYL